MKTLKATTVSYSENLEGREYFQVLFEEEGAPKRGGYVLLQRQFEMPDGGESYFECDEFERSGHYIIRKAKLSRNKFEIETPGRRGGKWAISFELEEDRYEQLKEVLKIILRKPSRLIIKGDS
jgi:hypothetical protein